MTLTKWDWATLLMGWSMGSAGGLRLLEEAALKPGLAGLVGMALAVSMVLCALILAALMTVAVLRKEAK